MKKAKISHFILKNSIENFFKKSQISNERLRFSKNVFKKPQIAQNCLTLLEKILNYSLNALKNPRIFLKSFIIIKKASISLKMSSKRIEIFKIHFKKASISLKMSTKRIEIFEKASNHFKKPLIFLKISLKCNAFFKKSLAISKKKSLVAISVLPQWPVHQSD
jgi:hypothetical protein